MKSFKQFIAEAVDKVDQPIEVSDLVKKPDAKKILDKIWGSDKLLFKGQKFFSDHDFGPVYENAIKVAEKRLKKMSINDSQEVYLGYSAKEDQLYIGFDVWRDCDGEPDAGFDGILFELSSENGIDFTAASWSDKPFGFYKGVYESKEFKNLGLFDLRLD